MSELVVCDQADKYPICSISNCPHRTPHTPEEYYGSICTDEEMCAVMINDQLVEVKAQCRSIDD